MAIQGRTPTRYRPRTRTSPNQTHLQIVQADLFRVALLGVCLPVLVQYSDGVEWAVRPDAALDAVDRVVYYPSSM